MAVPAATTRATPGGIPLKDGFRSKITFAADTDVSLWEKAVTPPGIDGGEGISQDTMFNTAWRIMRPRQLKTLTPVSFKAAYDPAVTTQIVALCNVETTITILWGDGSTVAFYGFLKSVQFGELVEGTQPEVSGEIVPTNWDYANDVEAGPTIVEVPGT